MRLRHCAPHAEPAKRTISCSSILPTATHASWRANCRPSCRHCLPRMRAWWWRATDERPPNYPWMWRSTSATATPRSQSTVTSQRTAMSVDKSIAVCPGSYDPITNGHLDVIRRAVGLYDEVVVAVVNRSVRKDKTLFGIEERMSFIEAALAGLPSVRAEPFNTLVVDFARQVGAKAIVKGLRAISDFEDEVEMNQLNRRQDPEIESVYLMASPQYSFLSSSGVKELATFGGRIDDLVPPRVAARLQEELAR